MSIHRTALIVGAMIAAITATTAANAATPADQATAEALFAEARKLAAAGDFASACPKFVESQRLDPTSGGALSVGNCLEKIGKNASAWGAFKEAEMLARDAKDAERAAEGARRAGLLSPQLAKLAILVPPAARVPGFELRRNGQLIGEGQWGSAVPVDTGQHTIEASAPGRKPWSRWVRIDTNSSSISVDVPPLDPLESANTVSPSFWGTQRKAGAIVGGVGVAGAIIGAVFGGLAIAKKSAMADHCQAEDPSKCDATGVDLRAEGVRLANGSNAAFAIGGAALITGLVVFLTAPSAKPPEPATSLRLAPIVVGQAHGISLMGSW